MPVTEHRLTERVVVWNVPDITYVEAERQSILESTTIIVTITQLREELWPQYHRS